MLATKLRNTIGPSCLFFFICSFSTVALEITTREYSSHSEDIYQTVDGTIFKKIGFGYVGYVGYHEEIIFLSSEEVCIDGDKYEIKVFEVGPSYHYSINTYEGAEAYAKLEEICGEIQ